jgi:hypothetical protein
MNESLAFHLLNRLPGVGAKTLRFLVGAFGSAQAAWEAPDAAWAALSKSRLAALAPQRGTLAPETETDNLDRDHIEVIPFSDPRFPTLLAEIPDAPALLYVRGNFRAWNERPLLAIVGSRKFTAYGKQVAAERTLQNAIATLASLQFALRTTTVQVARVSIITFFTDITLQYAIATEDRCNGRWRRIHRRNNDWWRIYRRKNDYRRRIHRRRIYRRWIHWWRVHWRRIYRRWIDRRRGS